MPPKRKTKTLKRKKAEDVLNFRVKRSHFYAVTVPLAFLLGLTAGYIAWGMNGTGRTAVPAADSGQSSSVSDIAAQLENLPRYEVPINADDPVFGPSDAIVTIVEFSDFECPYCQRHAQQTHSRLLEAYEGKIRIVYKDFPITGLHPNAYAAALAGQCAQEQDSFWPFHDLLFSGEMDLERDTYVTYAQQLGFDMDNFSFCLNEERYAETVQQDYDFGVRLGVSSTPTFFINGIALVGAQPFELFAQIIDYELSAQ